eukprot:Gb_39726 [translate_table: standard]
MAALRGSLETCTWIHQANAQMLTSGATHQLSNKSHSLSLKQQQQLSPSALSWNSNAGQTARRSFMAVGTKAEETQTVEAGVSYDLLRQRLAAGEWQLADEETRRLLIVLTGEPAVKRNYIFFSEVQFIPDSDLRTIDELWRTHSNNKFGYSVQRRIWKNVGQDFTEFFKKLGWMKRLDSEIEQYTYRSFPSEFLWELKDSTPDGHLPLTNALRGTQLLSSLLKHPAFDSIEEEENSKRPDIGIESLLDTTQSMDSKKMKTFTPDYKF